jgi:hypothetical protein
MGGEPQMKTLNCFREIWLGARRGFVTARQPNFNKNEAMTSATGAGLRFLCPFGEDPPRSAESQVIRVKQIDSARRMPATNPKTLTPPRFLKVKREKAVSVGN